MNDESPVSNAAEWSVSELSGALKRTLEDAFGHVRLRGEISGFRGPVASGHCYFSIKDQNAKIDAVIWKGVYARLRTRPQEGLEVIATGRITTFPGKSSYQIVIDAIEPAGIGALMAMIEERRRRLTAEGLFAEARKQLLPFLPEVIGVVTSPTGAVIRDILHRLEDRFPRRVVVWPVRVQGETSAQEVASAITGFNALAPGGRIPRPDLIIVARGGGSLEDLMSFNDEAVVRAAADSDIPLIAAVGHETDWTLIDLAADRRAPTPTGAAEMAVPVRSELIAAAGQAGRRLEDGIRRILERRRSELRGLERILPRGDSLLVTHRQRLDVAGGRLRPCLAQGFDRRHRALSRAAALLAAHSPRAELRARRAGFEGRAARLTPALLHRALAERRRALGDLGARLARVRASLAAREAERNAVARQRLSRLGAQLEAALRGGLQRRRQGLQAAGQLLRGLSYQGVLARGFALVRDRDGQPVRSAGAAGPGTALEIQFADGAVAATVDGGPQRPRPKARSTEGGGPAGQSSLF